MSTATVRPIPQDDRFFDFLRQQLQLLCEASELLVCNLNDPHALGQVCLAIKALEEKGDALVQKTALGLQATFLTPFEPEDVRAICSHFDDILDSIEEACFRRMAYRICSTPEEFSKIGGLIAMSCEALRDAMELLIGGKSIVQSCEGIKNLKVQADVLARKFLSDIFRTQGDPIQLLQCKEVIEALQHTADDCHHAASILENMSIRSSRSLFERFRSTNPKKRSQS